jgi:hypothetical protein
VRTLRDSQTTRAQAQITETKARIDHGDDDGMMNRQQRRDCEIQRGLATDTVATL